jgi:hypothetical protein
MKNNIPLVDRLLKKCSDNTPKIENNIERNNMKIDNIKSVKLEQSENIHGLVKQSITITFN